MFSCWCCISSPSDPVQQSFVLWSQGVSWEPPGSWNVMDTRRCFLTQLAPINMGQMAKQHPEDQIILNKSTGRCMLWTCYKYRGPRQSLHKWFHTSLKKWLEYFLGESKCVKHMQASWKLTLGVAPLQQQPRENHLENLRGNNNGLVVEPPL